MKILTVHNYYQQPGGEDQTFKGEGLMLEQYGNTVIRYTLHNDEVDQFSKLALLSNTLWSRQTYDRLRKVIRAERPDVLHAHNLFPLASPSLYYAATREGVPVIQTLQNYRLLCPNAQFMRDGKVCESCLGKSLPWPGVRYKCYRDSLAASSAVTAMLVFHRLLRTWQRKVNTYIVCTEFARQKFIEGGMPADKIVVKPNFLTPDPGIGTGEGGFALFVGRLSEEKGIIPMIEAWKQVDNRLRLVIAGDGPLSAYVRAADEQCSNLEWVGLQPHDEVLRLMKQASFLVFPSVWYEAFPLTLVEAFATGLPVISSRLGSMSSLIEHQRTGLHVTPGDVADLVSAVAWMDAHPEKVQQMRTATRAMFESKYTAEINIKLLMDIYERATQASV